MSSKHYCTKNIAHYQWESCFTMLICYHFLDNSKFGVVPYIYYIKLIVLRLLLFLRLSLDFEAIFNDNFYIVIVVKIVNNYIFMFLYLFWYFEIGAELLTKWSRYRDISMTFILLKHTLYFATLNIRNRLVNDLQVQEKAQ